MSRSIWHTVNIVKIISLLYEEIIIPRSQRGHQELITQCKIKKLKKDNKTIHKLNTHEVYDNLDLVSWV